MDWAACEALWRDSLPDQRQYEQAELVHSWLVQQYRQPWRAYHTLSHVERMFALWRELGSAMRAADRHAVALAIWFHDAVYDPRRQDNEVQSADEAVRRLSPLGTGEERLDRIRRMILATAAHEPSGEDADTALILDLDLAILGAEPDAYDAYARAIRQEYGFVEEEAYRTGRVQVLQKFLDRSRIYATPAMSARFEARARQNLAREIEALRLGPHT